MSPSADTLPLRQAAPPVGSSRLSGAGLAGCTPHTLATAEKDGSGFLSGAAAALSPPRAPREGSYGRGWRLRCGVSSLPDPVISPHPVPRTAEGAAAAARDAVSMAMRDCIMLLTKLHREKDAAGESPVPSAAPSPPFPGRPARHCWPCPQPLPTGRQARPALRAPPALPPHLLRAPRTGAPRPPYPPSPASSASPSGPGRPRRIPSPGGEPGAALPPGRERGPTWQQRRRWGRRAAPAGLSRSEPRGRGRGAGAGRRAPPSAGRGLTVTSEWCGGLTGGGGGAL